MASEEAMAANTEAPLSTTLHLQHCRRFLVVRFQFYSLSLSLSLSLVVYLILGLILKFGDFVHVLVFMVIWVCVGIIPLC
jgi:hypothetical protein